MTKKFSLNKRTKKILEAIFLSVALFVSYFIFPSALQAQGTPSLSLGRLEITSLANAMWSITYFLLELGWIVAIIMVMISGIKYMTSSGNPEARTKAVKSLSTSVIGFVILATFWSLLRFFLAFIEYQSPAEARGGTDIAEIISSLLNYVLGIGGVVSVIYLIMGGFKYITSGGSEKAVGEAKNTILYAIVGLVIIIAAFAIKNYIMLRIKTSG